LEEISYELGPLAALKIAINRAKAEFGTPNVGVNQPPNGNEFRNLEICRAFDDSVFDFGRKWRDERLEIKPDG
jgi:hypothetical protein